MSIAKRYLESRRRSTIALDSREFIRRAVMIAKRCLDSRRRSRIALDSREFIRRAVMIAKRCLESRRRSTIALDSHEFIRRAVVVILLLALSTTFTHAQSTDLELPVVNKAITLVDAVDIARRYNADILGADADAVAAHAQARSVRAQQSLSISTTTVGSTGNAANIITGSPGAAPLSLMAVPNTGYAGQTITFMAPLFTGGRLQSESRSAREQAAAGDATARSTVIATVDTVSLAYDKALEQQALVDTAQARLDAENEQLRITRQQASTGAKAAVDVSREQAEQADAFQAVIAAQNDAATALADLKVALGISQDSQITLADTLAGLASGANALPSSQDAALRLADANRPELVADGHMVDAARAAVADARGAYAPQVYAVAMGSGMTSGGTSSTGYTVGLTASLPLYDAGSRQGSVDAAQARLDRAVADKQAARQKVDRDVVAAWLDLQSATAERSAAESAVSAAQQTYDLTTMRYNAGKTIDYDRIDALAALTRSRGSLAQVTAALLDAQANLHAAIGGN